MKDFILSLRVSYCSHFQVDCHFPFILFSLFKDLTCLYILFIYFVIKNGDRRVSSRDSMNFSIRLTLSHCLSIFKIIKSWVLDRPVISLWVIFRLNSISAKNWHDQSIDWIGPLWQIMAKEVCCTWPLIDWCHGLLSHQVSFLGWSHWVIWFLCRDTVGVFYSANW